MTRPISTRTHGIIDLAFSGTLIALPFLLKWNGRARKLAISGAVATLGNTLMTNFEFGVVKVLPMKAHLSIDAGEASALLSARKMLGEHEKWPARVLALMGAVESMVGAMTKTQSPYELAPERPALAS
jgi:hypothetical protein